MSAADLGDPDEAGQPVPNPAAADRSGPDDESAVVRAAVRAVRGGDHDPFGRLLELYQRRLFGLALMMVRDPEGAEEVAQDAFVRAFTRLNLYDERRPFYPWLATIAVRLAQNWLRRRRRLSAREAAPLDPQRTPAVASDPVDRLIHDERRRGPWRSVAALPSGQRTAVTLYYREGMKVSEVARALGVTSGTVKTLLFRARNRLRDTMNPAAGPAAPIKEPT